MIDKGRINNYRYRMFITQFGVTDIYYFRSIEYMKSKIKELDIGRYYRIEIQAMTENNDFIRYEVIAVKEYSVKYFLFYNGCPKTLNDILERRSL